MLSARRLVLIACLGADVVGVCDCKRARKEEKPAMTTLTSAALRDSVEDASQRVASARCAQEVSCAHLTGWTREANMTACLDRVKVETARELGPEVCSRGIDHDRLIDCVAAIERTSCDDPVSRLMQLEDCRKNKLCIGP